MCPLKVNTLLHFSITFPHWTKKLNEFMHCNILSLNMFHKHVINLKLIIRRVFYSNELANKSNDLSYSLKGS